MPGKGFDTLIRAFRFLPQNTKLLIAGPVHDLAYYEYLRSMAGETCPGKVLFLGVVSVEDLPKLYNLCDVFVQPSLYYDYLGRYHPSSELLGLSKLELWHVANLLS